jgi:AsmA protein
MRTLKIVGISIGGFIALIALVLLGVRLFVNPNDYKARIEKTVSDATGRDLALPGDIKLSVFPWIALELGPASLGNPPGFGNKPFAAIQHLSVRVMLLPLLRKEIEIGRIEIEGLDLRLLKNAQGKGNWESFGGKTSAATPVSKSTSTTPLPELAGLEIKDSRVSYQDLIVDHLNVEVGRVSAGTAVPVKLSFTLTTSPGASPIPLASQLELTLDSEKKQYRVEAFDLDGTLTPKAGVAPVKWKFSAPQVSMDLGAQILSAENFNARLGSANLTGTVHGKKILDAPDLTGDFKLDPVGLRELMHELRMVPPETRDSKVLSKLAAKGEFAYAGNAARASKLDMQLDDSDLRGALAVTNLATKAMTFDLALDRIDLDRYMSPEKANPKPAAKPETQPIALPTDALKGLLLNGTATIGSAKIAGLALSQVRVSVDIKGDVMHLAPLQAKLYGGTYSGDITLDERTHTPVLKLEQGMNDIDVAALLKDFAKTQRLSGRGNVTTNLTAEGATSDTLMKSLSGHATANLASGAVEGVDLWFELNRALSLIQKQALPTGTSSGRTKFDTFKASADLSNGVASTKDLTIASQNLHITGQGTSNLVSEAIDYQMKATLLGGSPGSNLASNKTLVDIPVTITGTMSDPKVRPDLASLAKTRVEQQLKQTLQDKLKGLWH